MNTIDFKPEKILAKRPRKERTDYPVGMRIGSLTILERITDTPDTRTNYLTQCDCGNKKEIRSKDIKAGYAVSCNPCRYKKKADAVIRDTNQKEIGQTYNDWTVIKFVGISHTTDNRRRSRYLIRHTCGAEAVPAQLYDVKTYGRLCVKCKKPKKKTAKIKKPSLRKGRIARTYIAYGERFNKWTCIGSAEPRYDGRTQCLCKCDCGTEEVVAVTDLKRGATIQCISCYEATWNIYKPEEAFSDEIGKIYWGWTVIKFNSIHIQPSGRALKRYWVQHVCGNKRCPTNFKSVKLRGLTCTQCTLR